MAERSKTHVVLIPSYNPGPKVYATVGAALEQWNPVWVVVDGSTDGSAERLTALAAGEPGLRVFVLPKNRGKGAAVLHGLREAAARGYTHALTMDSDGQHPADRIVEFMRVSQAQPAAMVLGYPIFDSSAPRLRVHGRKTFQLVGQRRNAVGRRRRLAVRLSRLSDRAAHSRDATAALDAAFRLRRGSGGAALLARRQADQYSGAGALFPPRGGRCFALQLLPGQRPPHLDACAAVFAALFCGCRCWRRGDCVAAFSQARGFWAQYSEKMPSSTWRYASAKPASRSALRIRLGAAHASIVSQ